MRRSVRVSAVLFATITAAGAFAAPAQAAATGVASVSGTKVQYRAAKGKQNRVVVTRSGRSVTIDDQVAIRAGKGCTAVDRTRVRCRTSKTPTRVLVYTYDRADSVVNRAALSITADGGTGPDKLTGGSRADILLGGTGADKLYGKGGNDTLDGKGGNDYLAGADGDDRLYGGSGNDVLHGTKGNDYLVPGSGHDKGYGGPGEDAFQMGKQAAAGTDDDYISGGTGESDSLSYSRYTIGITADADGVKGDDGAKGEHDTIEGDIERIRGGAGNDVLNGTYWHDYLYGGPGDDILNGLMNDDWLFGEEGRDKLYGGPDDDVLDGSDGADPNGQDLLDGGGDGISAGDVCKAYGDDTKVDCEF